jgi:hypothetical protein
MFEQSDISNSLERNSIYEQSQFLSHATANQNLTVLQKLGCPYRANKSV